MDDFGSFAQNYQGPMVDMGNSLPGNPGATGLSSPEPQPAQPSGGGGFLGWLARNAQNIGAAIGGVGAPILADVATGGLATPFDPLISAAGASLGGGGGQEIKNLTTGTKTNPFEEGAISGALDLGGGLVGDMASPLLSRAGGALDRFGTNLLTQVGGTVDKSTARALKAFDTTRFMSDLGVNPNNYRGVSQAVMDTLDPLVTKGVGKAGQVDTSGLKDMANQLIGLDTRIGDNASKKASSFINSTIDKLAGVEDVNAAPLTKSAAASTTDVLNGADPNGTLDAIRSLQSKASDLAGKGKNPLTVTDESRGVANIYNQVASELEDRLYKNAGADAVVANGLVGKDTVAALQKALPDTPLARRFIQAISGAKTIGELRSAQAPFVKAAQLAAEKTAEAGTAGATNRNLVKGGLEMAGGLGGLLAAPASGGLSLALPAAELALTTDIGKTTAGNALRGVGKVLTGGGENAAEQVGRDLTIPAASATQTPADILRGLAKQTAGKTALQAGGRAVGTALGGSPSVSQANDVPTSLSSYINSALMSNPQTAMLSGSTPANGGPGSAMPTQEQFNQLEQQYGLRGVSNYLDYIRLTQPQLSQEQQTNWVQGQTLLSRLQQVAQLYSKSNAGPLTGRLSELSGVLGTSAGANAQSYDAQRDELANTLVRFINEGGRSGGAQLTNMLRQELPTLGDSPQTAAIKFQTIVDAVVMQMQNNLAAPATNTPGQLTSFAGQLPQGGSAGNPGATANNILSFVPPAQGAF